MARSLGVLSLMVSVIALLGPTVASTPCSSNEDCTAEEFCWLPNGVCAPQDPIGICSPIPIACTAEFIPVCGCDYQSYGNWCYAHWERASVLHQGSCEPCESSPCGPEEFCRLPDGECVSGLGECLVPPDSCETTCPGVCACDGQSYSNECEAIVAGVTLRHHGVCNDVGDGIVTDVSFTPAGKLDWTSESGTSSYNIYRNIVPQGSPPGALTCFLGDVFAPPRDLLNDPGPGEVWFLLVNGNFDNGEGSLGQSTDCVQRIPAGSCH